MIDVRDTLLYPLQESERGLHVFGGVPSHRGVTPAGSAVPVHKLLTIDLRDEAIPFRSDSIDCLPLYYPLKYGFGGPSMQYSMVSNDEIHILHISDAEPDPPDEAYVRVDAFPEIRFSAQSAIENDDDIDWFTLTLGGTGTLGHRSDPCENASCPNYHKAPDVDLIASIPPKPIPGHEDIWWEFEGGYILFYFWLCRGCKTVIASNRST
ncbi:hypothetical protein LOC67_27050 [Stieleria sp. JC731]|uniref:hypothetical protein n=1 Tax=Stieleria sp. JC731 TaxID=2894195 RepID=UPI001E3820D7|nr:hypothetical protein [Stieleria sp. JC731]MCC9604228.1 hypothetical protein [Stieleria sp. JC731]